jgi:hypothetical protein
MKTVVTASLFAMLLMAGAAIASDRSDPPAVPSKGTEGPDIRYAQVETHHSLNWSHVR